MLSMTHYAKNYAGIIGESLHPGLTSGRLALRGTCNILCKHCRLLAPCPYFSYINYAKSPMSNYGIVLPIPHCLARGCTVGHLLALWLLRLAMGHGNYGLHNTCKRYIQHQKGKCHTTVTSRALCHNLPERWRAPLLLIRLQWPEFYRAVMKLIINKYMYLASWYICWQHTEEFVWLKDYQSTLLRLRRRWIYAVLRTKV